MRKKLFTFLLALTASIGMMWAETVVVINKSEFTSSGVTKEGVTLALSSGSMTSSETLAMEGSFKFSTSLGKFTGITIETDINIVEIYEGAFTSAGWPTGDNLGTSAVWTGESDSVLISCMVAGNTITITCTIEEPAPASAGNSITINGTPAVGDNSISLTYYFDPANVPGITGYAPTLKVKCVTDNIWDEEWLSLSEISSGTTTITLNELGSFQAGKSYEVCFAYYNGSWVDEMFQSFSFDAPTPTDVIPCTAEDLGKVLCTDGSIYATVSEATAASKTAVAMIAYVDTENGKALALALADESGTMDWETAKTTAAAHTPAVSGGTWTLASKDDWNNMITAAGDYTALRDGFSAVGGTNMQQAAYWSSTPENTNAWRYYFTYGGMWTDGYVDNPCYVRACLTFDIPAAPAFYTVALEEGTVNADKVTLSATSAVEGATVTVTPVEGYEITDFSAYYVVVNGQLGSMYEIDATLNTETGAYSFTMPAANVTIEATIAEKAAPAPAATVTWNSSNISNLTVNGNSYSKEGVTLSPNASNNYAYWLDYGDESQNGIYFYVNATGGHTFSNSLGKNFTKIEMTLNGSTGWYVAYLGSGWNIDGMKVIWTGNASTVDLLTETSSFGGAAGVKSIVFYFEGDSEDPDPTPAEDVDITPNVDPQNAGVYYSTFYDSANKYALPAGVEAYVADLSGANLLLTKIAEAGEVIPANVAVILKSTVTPFTLAVSDADAVTFTATNDLQGSDTQIATPANCYVLAGTDGVVGFYHYTAANLNAHKAYVIYAPSQNQAPRHMPFVFNQATGVEDINAAVESIKRIENGQLIIIKNGVKYNAQGKIVK